MFSVCDMFILEGNDHYSLNAALLSCLVCTVTYVSSCVHFDDKLLIK